MKQIVVKLYMFFCDFKKIATLEMQKSENKAFINLSYFLLGVKDRNLQLYQRTKSSYTRSWPLGLESG